MDNNNDEMLPKIKQFLMDRMNRTAQLQQAGADQAMDRIKMSNPNVQGPHLPQVTPEDQEYVNNNMGAMMGGIAPIAGLEEAAGKGVADVAEASAKKVADQAAAAAQAGNATAQDVAMAQQKLSRAADFTDRNAQQIKDYKLSRLKGMMGR